MSKSVFYLEDDGALAQITIKAFQRFDFDVMHFQNLESARNAIGKAHYTHALLDMKLEDGNALALIEALSDKHPQMTILLLTGYASIATAVQAIKLGAHNYLAKPASIEEILGAFGEQTKLVEIPKETMSLKRIEWEKIQHALLEHDGNISLTAKHLNMHRRTLQRKLNKRPVLK